MRKRGTYKVQPIAPIRVPENNDLSKLIDNLNQAHLQLVNQINTHLQNAEQRLDTIQQIGAKAPQPVSGVSVQGQQGALHVTWTRIANVDGYILVYSDSSGMVPIRGRVNIPDGEQSSYQITVGNIVVSYYVQLFAYRGNQTSNPSPAVKGTTVTFSISSSDTSPSLPPVYPATPFRVPVRNGTTKA